MITSKTNQKIKYIKKLLGSARARRESGQFVIEGARLFAEAPASLVETVFLSEDCRIDVSGYPDREIVAGSVFRDLSDTVSPQGILALVRQPEWNPAQIASTGKVLLLDGIRDPGNLGTIVRTAEAAGVRCIYMSPDCVDLYNPKVIRSTMGSIFRVPVLTADLVSVIRSLRERHVRVYATSLQAEMSYREADLENAAIIIGSEADGVSRPVLSAASELIRIPMAGQVESLNAAVSAAVLMFS